MDRAAFEALIARTEEFAARNPTAYRWRVYALAAVGYLYLALVVLALVALFVAVITLAVYSRGWAIKLVPLVGAPLLVVLRAMRVKLERPTGGVTLTRANSPELFRMLEELRRRLNTPRLHHVLLTPDFNAGVAQLPRLGLLGWHQTYLLLGLPLMKALTVEQFQAVLAHELGHLSRGHARAANWIYRIRIIWQHLSQAFTQKSHVGSVLIQPFLKRYIPYFAATSFPLARANEYEADATSVKLTSARSTAQALTSVNVIGSYLNEKYWPAIQEAAKDTPQPAFAPFSDSVASAVQQIPLDLLKRWQDTALERKTSYADTHPCLADRLKAIGAQAEFAPPAPGSGAEALLGPERSQWESSFDERWRERVAESWKKIHERTQSSRTRLAELRSKAAESELDEAGALELSNLEEEVGEGPVAALAMRRTLAEKYPDSMPIRFALARRLLMNNESEGVLLMESVVGATPDAVMAGAQILRDFYARQNDLQRARQWHERYAERTNVQQAAQRERSTWLLSESIAAHQLPAEELAKLVTQLQAIPDVRRAYLIRKVTRHFPERPMYVLGIASTKWWRLYDRAQAHALVQRIKQEVRFPGETLIVSIEGNNYKFARKMRRVKRSRII
jgi:Zn-dependent protease with chaperone function